MSRLLKATFDCEVITPMFLGGADSNVPEIRVPGIRGALRFWLRAILGGRGLIDSKSLNKYEESILGSSDKGSSVAIRVKDKNFTTTRGAKAKAYNAGSSYLWYSVDMGRENDKKFITPNSRFQLELRSFDKEKLILVSEALCLLSKLGGIGSRSRRCAGSFEVVNCISSEQAVSKLFENTNEEIWKYFKDKEQRIDSKPEFAIFNSEWAQVIKCTKSFNKWEDAVGFIGQKFQSYRSKRGLNEGGDYDKVRGFIENGSTVNSIERVAFGLPLSFRFRTIRNGNNSANMKIVGNQDINRRASQLHLQIKCEDGNYVPYLTVFNSKFLPNNVSVQINSGRSREVISHGEFESLVAFTESIDDKKRMY